HHRRHPGWEAVAALPAALAAGRLVGEALIEQLLIFGRERSLLREASRLDWIKRTLAAHAGRRTRAQPLTFEVWVLSVVESLSGRPCQAQGRQGDKRGSFEHIAVLTLSGFCFCAPP